MQLLSPKEATQGLRKKTDELMGTSVRLTGLIRRKQTELNSLKNNYDPEKVKAKAEFDAFCKDLQEKKSKLLQELAGIEAAVEAKKDMYFALVEKQDALDERAHAVTEREKKCELRENLISELERAWKKKTT